jgi:uncharacterized protein YeaO (DUF488 family)
MELKIKRVYEKPETEDGMRILVDRLWPRGMTKEKACIRLWLKDIAPTTELRKWFGHDIAKWAEFRERYMLELETNETQVSILKQHLKAGPVTLVYAGRDGEHNEAVILRELFGC